MAGLRLLILAGGPSDEHEVSLVSARSVLDALARHPGIAAEACVVGRDGAWLAPEPSARALAAGRAVDTGDAPLARLELAGRCDVVLPLIHGPIGEDGTLQGLLELAHVPYVGAGVLASALCMDKAMSKRVLASAGVPQVDHRLLTGEAIARDALGAARAVAQMPGPWFVKPNNLGSSVGIRKVARAAELPAALEHAARFGRRVIVEAGVAGAREIEVAVLGNDAPQASVVGEITYDAEFYDYETKYTPGRAALLIPAPVPEDVAGRARDLARQAFVLVDAAGLARVDFFLTASGELLLNELNTLPGFTPLSMYPKLWAHSGIAYPDLIERLCALAVERHGRSQVAPPTARRGRA